MSLFVESSLSEVVATLVGGRVRLVMDEQVTDLHQKWLRDMSEEPGQIEPTNRQRLFTPLDILSDLSCTSCDLRDDVLVVNFSDGHSASYPLTRLLRVLWWLADPEERPDPEPWDRPFEPFPYVDW